MAKKWVMKLGNQIVAQSTSNSFSYNFPENDDDSDRTYTVSVTDDMGCSTSQDIIVPKCENNSEDEMKEFFCEFYSFMLLKDNGRIYEYSYDNSGRGGDVGISSYYCDGLIYQVDKEFERYKSSEVHYESPQEKFAVRLEAFTFDVECDEIRYIKKWKNQDEDVNSTTAAKLDSYLNISEDPYKGTLYITIKENDFTTDDSTGYDRGVKGYDLEVEVLPTFYYEGKQYTLGTFIRIYNIPFKDI